ncbi:MAG: hypothetical protein AAF360_13765 [Pseudomonadota bacterium]
MSRLVSIFTRGYLGSTGGAAIGREITVRIDLAPKVVLIDPKPGVCHGGAN